MFQSDDVGAVIFAGTGVEGFGMDEYAIFEAVGDGITGGTGMLAEAGDGT